MSTIHVVGLGPGNASLLTRETEALLRSGLPVIVRTRRHPTLAELDPEARFASCDDLYEAGGSFEAVYGAVVERLLAAAQAGDVIYAVPGHPLVAESSVLRLRQDAPESITVRVYPALSYVDAAATALGIDLGTVQLCDALALRIDAQRPALISQVYDRETASGLKLVLLEIYPADHPVTVLRALGTAATAVTEMELSRLDHDPAGYLDCVYVPSLAAIDDVRRFDGLEAIVRRLHAPGGCPWDREQTHETLRHHLLEEAYEALEAIDSGDPASMAEELGDLLLQVLMHAEVGARLDEFTLADVTEHIGRKLVRRHPHVFGETTADTAEQVYQNWEKLKQDEKPRSSVLEGVPVSLPALAASQSIQGRARRIGFDWPGMEGPLDKLREEIGEFAAAEDTAGREDEFGDILFVIVGIAERLGINAEQALRGANAKFRGRFGRLEATARGRQLDLKELDIAALLALWEEAKAEDAGRSR